MTILVVFAILVLLATVLGHDSRDGKDWTPVPPR
jgi:hypothetical protein